MTSEKMARSRERRRVLTGSLHGSDIHGCSIFTSVAGWLENRGASGEEIVREFYASYATTLRGSISKRSKPLASGPDFHIGRGCGRHIPATRRFLYGPLRVTLGPCLASLTLRWDIVRSGAFGGITAARGVIHWLAKYILCGWRRARMGSLLRVWASGKATLTFVAKFLRSWCVARVSPTKADNQVRGDEAVMVAALVAGVEIDFAASLGEIHERALRTSRLTLSLPYFSIVRGLGVPIGIVAD
ncbi:hypothetical protein H5410_014819 [Solanum commersonii]|uniref:Uncharacterized protein n=1 Tax=Solanum commersonii TaxID=4109 RepID=A0A9J5ZSC0_SOLCO|nr:hypothetical protein H5410_014819 [Solanum commersonii]